jgi:hypothetical protein
LIFGDGPGVTTNPKQIYVEWARHISSVEVERPLSQRFEVLPGASLTLFSGTRATSIDGTSQFSIALNTSNSSVYRITNTSGTAPAFRTARAYNPSGVAHTLVVNNNATLEISIPSGNFNAQVGDAVFFPATSTGDAASPFSPLNAGLWTVIAATALKLTLVRPTGVNFQGAAEVITPTLASQLLIYSASGVQAGDGLEISGGFSTVTQQAFVVSSVTPSWVEFVSTQSLPLESGILPGASGMTFYTAVKRFVRLEVDQSCVVRFNGDTGNWNRLSPLVAGDLSQAGSIEMKWGPVWSLTVVNRAATSTMVANLITCE